MRHDDQRPQLDGWAAETPVPGHWIDVLAQMRTNPLTCMRVDEVRAATAHIVIVAPSAQVVEACFGDLLEGFDGLPDVSVTNGSGSDSSASDPCVEVVLPSPDRESLSFDRLDAGSLRDVPAGTWVFLPHRHDGWTDLEDASAKLRALLVKENAGRSRDAKLILVEYGVNLWLWAEPPHSGGDPVCHAGELISWESAWALADADIPGATRRSISIPAADHNPPASPEHPASSTPALRPPIYFGLPPLLRARRMV